MDSQVIPPTGVEAGRINFYLARDGIEKTIDFVAMVHKAYRLNLKHGFAKSPLFRRGYVQSTIGFRSFLRNNDPDRYISVLRSIKYS